MSRPLRLQYAGAVYHVTARGQRQQAIYRDDTDRFVWLDTLAKVCQRFKVTVHGFCQMTNHYHLLLETGAPNLADGMRQLNAIYAQYFNRRHVVAGHLFQGRYTAILVQKDTHLRELARYVVLNPVRARMVADVADWPWSSYRSMVRQQTPPSWLQTDWMLAQFGTTRPAAIDAYRRFIAAGIGCASPLGKARHQLLLGDDRFAASHRQQRHGATLDQVSKAQRSALVLPLADYQALYAERDAAIVAAYLSMAYSMGRIAAHFGVSTRTVSRIVGRQEEAVQPSSCPNVRLDPGYK